MKKLFFTILISITSIVILIIINNSREFNNVTQYDISLENVKMEIKEGTLNENSAIIIICDNNEKTYGYGEWFRIDKKENGKWKELKAIKKGPFFTEIAWGVNEDKKLEMQVNWKNIYGTLVKGEYRLVKRVYDNEYRYFSTRFVLK